MDLELLEQAARRRLDAAFYDYIAGGSEDEETLVDNAAAWSRMRLRPKVLRDVDRVDLSTTALGAPVASPIGVAPMAMQHRACEDGPVATARAAAATGSLLVFGLFGAGSAGGVAEVESTAPRWLQVYVLKDRARSAAAIARSVEEGYAALVLTVDVVRQGNRRRDARNRWVFLREGDEAEEDPNELFDRSLTFDDIAWFRERAGVPLVIKGVMRGDDAAACVDAGAAAVIVSNHGGRQLDGAAATADVLREVVEAVGDRGEVYVDGGIRRGQHVLKALALGARGVMLGRPVMWGLAAGGRLGAQAVLRGFQQELERAMALSGVRSVPEIGPDLLHERG
ncbi:MAG: alpha-hydroxy-acid oxidizing protein [Proteobacteria bacterium]|nr:alpha-hydroxy-acid oxidizing protein [Pseudomonadota bacterium]